MYFQTEDIITESVHVLANMNCSDWIVLWVSFSSEFFGEFPPSPSPPSTIQRNLRDVLQYHFLCQEKEVKVECPGV